MAGETSGAPRVRLGGGIDPRDPDHNIGEVMLVGFASEYILDVAAGLVPGHKICKVFGAIKYVTPFNQWKAIAGSQTYFTPQVPVSLELVSDSANDASGGSGLLSVRVFGLKTAASTIEEFEDVALNGLTPVALANDWFRVYHMHGRISGSYANHLGSSHDSIITLREVATPTNIWTIIDKESGFGLAESEVGVFSIPNGQDGYLLDYHAHVSDTNKAGSIGLFSRDQAQEQAPPYTGIMHMSAIHRNVGAGGDAEYISRVPKIAVSGIADVGFMCIGTAGMELDIDFTILCITQ